MLLLVLTYVLCTAAIVAAAAGLSKYADMLSEITGIGKAWVGMTFVAIATSLPELSTGISGVVYAHSPNIALGDALGSCVFNLAIIALIDFMSRAEPIQFRLGPGSLLAASSGVVIIGTAIVGLSISRLFPVTFWHVSVFSPLLITGFLAASRLEYLFEKKLSATRQDQPVLPHTSETPLRRVIYMLVLCASVVALAGTILPKTGVMIADELGVGHGFIGSVFIAMSTSLPEVTVAVSCVRINSIDMAVGNLFGSNIFNCVIIAIDDIFYTQGSIFRAAAPGHVITAAIAIVMTGVALVGLLYKSRLRSFMKIGWDSVALIALYLLNILTSYGFSGGQ